MKGKWITVVGAGIVAAALSVAVPCFASDTEAEVTGGSIVLHHQSEAQYPALAKISSSQAVSTALKAVRGHVVKTELEDENGFLVYEVEVARPDHVIMEVLVDAGTGKVLATAPDEDAHHGGDND
jgi:uncharacterized membrane protein YkoI